MIHFIRSPALLLSFKRRWKRGDRIKKNLVYSKDFSRSSSWNLTRNFEMLHKFIFLSWFTLSDLLWLYWPLFYMNRTKRWWTRWQKHKKIYLLKGYYQHSYFKSLLKCLLNLYDIFYSFHQISCCISILQEKVKRRR